MDQREYERLVRQGKDPFAKADPPEEKVEKARRRRKKDDKE